MALSNYTELKASIADWLARDSLTAIIPDFIAMCETQFNRRLRIRIMENTLSLTTVAGTGTVALPANFKSMRVIYLDSDPDHPLNYRTPEQLIKEYPSTNQSRPLAYTLEGDNIRLGPIPDAAYSLSGIYYKAVSALSDSNLTNVMLTANPDLYLYGTLLQAAPYLGQDARINVWSTFYLQILEDIQTEDDLDRHFGASLQMRTDTNNP